MTDASGNGQAPADTLALIRKELVDLYVNQAKIKLREWADLEDKTGLQVNPWIGNDFPPIWFMQGVLWLWLRRKHPQLRFEDFGELDLEDLQKARNPEQAPDPTEPSAPPPAPPPSPASATSGA